MHNLELASAIKEKALEIGFDSIGYTAPSLPERKYEELMAFLSKGNHGSMDWLEDRARKRASPDALWPDVKSVIMLGMNYGPDTDPRALLSEKDYGNISVYARGKDYHDIIKKRLKRLARWIIEQEKCDLKVFVDTAPVMEKPLAAASGIGWQGKHTNLVSREFGSWLFIGAIYTTLELPVEEPGEDRCGSCSSCLDVCPTHAFQGPRKIDARKCISYLTIEHKGAIPEDLRKLLGNRIYGCDDCLAACPWNKYAQIAKETKLHAKEELKAPRLDDLVKLDDPSFRSFFSGSPIKRIGRDRFIRNVLYAIGNSGNTHFINEINPLRNDTSKTVQEAACWAIQQLKTTQGN